jgi:glycosyltransferase involved in cell wall biosynthesis
MRLLFYSPTFAPKVGGMETIVLSIANGLAELRTPDGLPEFEITFVTPTAAGEFDDRALPFRVIRQPGIRQLRRLIGSTDVLHMAGPVFVPLLLGLLARKPAIVEHHGFQTVCPTGQLLIEPAGEPCPGHFMAGRYSKCLRCNRDGNWRRSFLQWASTFFRRWFCKHIDRNIMPTEWLAGVLKLPRAITIPHGLEVHSADDRLAPLVVPGGQISRPSAIVYQGRLVSSKGISVLLEAAGLLRARERRFELIVIGDGPERPALERRAQELGLSSQIRFAGRLGSSQLEATLKQAGIVVMPSLAGEVFGLVTAENMARGLAVVASDVGSLSEVLGDAGLTFRVGDAQDLARQLERLLEDAAFASSLGARARQRIFESFSRAQMVAAHARVYRDVLATSRG